MKKIDVRDAAEKYYNRHKKELNKLFGGKRSAVSHLRFDTNAPSYFKKPGNATRLFNDYVDRIKDPAGWELKHAKKDAFDNTPGAFKKLTELNNRVDKNGLTPHTKYIGQVNGFDVEVEEYYDIKNSNYVLAHNRYDNGTTELYMWEFIDRSLL